jgi:hypothetical protein
MNKRQIIASLNNIANELDNSGLFTESNVITNVMMKLAQMPQVSPISKPNQDAFGYQAAVDKWITTNKQAVDNALKSDKPMQVLAPLLMNVQPTELANAIRVKIGQMKQGIE